MHEICHFEIPALDVGRAASFYASLFGWKMNPFGDSGEYTMFAPDKEPGGGIMKVKEVKASGLIFYVHVADIPEAITKAESLGARKVQDKTPIPGHGFWASFADTEGNIIGLFSRT